MTFGLIHLDDKRLASCLDIDALLPVKVPSAYPPNRARSNESFSCRPFYYKADRLVKALRACLNDIRASNNGLFEEDKFNRLLAVQVPLSPTFKPAVAQIFVENI